MYYVYMLRCKDNSIYTGITSDLERRMKEHFTDENGKAAKYTKSHRPSRLETYFEFETRSDASKEEYRIKQLKKNEKEKMIEEFRKNEIR